MRLIDADALFAEFENVDWYNNADRDEIAERLVLQAPTIDAVSVVHGEWKPFDLTWGRSLYACSVCGEVEYLPCDAFNGKPLFKFCPNCGAKMKGEDDETN